MCLLVFLTFLLLLLEEYQIVQESLPFTNAEMVQMIDYGFRSAFANGLKKKVSEEEKQKRREEKENEKRKRRRRRKEHKRKENKRIE